MKKFIWIKGDHNDADYVAEMNEIDDKTLTLIMPVINAIAALKKKPGYAHTWPTHNNSEKVPSEIYPECTREQLDWFYEYVPSGPYGGIHSIEEIKIYHVKDIETLV